MKYRYILITFLFVFVLAGAGYFGFKLFNNKTINLSKNPIDTLITMDAPKGPLQLLIRKDEVVFQPSEIASGYEGFTISKTKYPKLFEQGVANASLIEANEFYKEGVFFVDLSNQQSDHGGYGKTFLLRVNPETKQTSEVQLTDQSTSEKNPIEAYLIKNNLSAISISPEKLIMSDGQEFTILTAVYEGCASCHANQTIVFKGNEAVFTYYGDDAEYKPILDGFVIVKPERKENEGMSSPSDYSSAIFKWNGKTFVKTHTTNNWVDDVQEPG